MPRLKKYPSARDVRALVREGWIEEKLDGQSPVEKTRYVATLSLDDDFDPALLRAYLDFSAKVKELMPDVTMRRDFSIVREKSREERIHDILQAEADRRYNHPEEYAEYASSELEKP